MLTLFRASVRKAGKGVHSYSKTEICLNNIAEAKHKVVCESQLYLYVHSHKQQIVHSVFPHE